MMENNKHYPQVGDIWKASYYPDLFWKKDVCIDLHFLVYEADGEEFIGYCFEEDKTGKISAIDWNNTVAKNTWLKVA